MSGSKPKVVYISKPKSKPLKISLVAQMVKYLPVMWEAWNNPYIGKIPWKRAWQPIPVFLPGESPWTEEPGGLQSMGLKRLRHY